MKNNIYSWITEQENEYQTQEIQVGDNWNWNMNDHVQLLFHLKNGIFYTGENKYLRYFKKIMKPIIQLANWTEDIEVKDIVFYITGERGKALSFLLKKYHDEVYTRKHNIDELIDGVTETDNTYGGVLVQKGKDCPEIIVFNTIAFCDQTDLLGSPIAMKHNFSPSKLRQMTSKGWGDTRNGATISIDELITLAEDTKESEDRDNQIPGANIEVYVVRGDMPNHFLYDDDDVDNYTDQIQVVAYYTDKKKNKQGVTLYRKQATDQLKAHITEPIYGRALGGSVGEDMIQPQVWANFVEIHKMGLLEASSKVPLYTDDPTWRTKNKIQDMENLEITTIADNKRVYRVPTDATANIQLYEQAANDLLNSAQFAGAAFDPIMGKEATSGTTFRGQERTVAQGRGSHDRKRGKRSKFIEELYRDWIIPDMVKDITKGQKFLSTLSTDELTWVAETVSEKKTNKKIKEKLFKGEMVSAEEQAQLRELFKQDFLKSGNKQLLEILKDEFNGIEIEIGVNVANKQKNLADLSDKVLSIFQFVFANPQAFQQAMKIPALSKSFSDILEFSGMSMGDFSTLLQSPESPLELPEGQPSTMTLNPQVENETA